MKKKWLAQLHRPLVRVSFLIRGFVFGTLSFLVLLSILFIVFVFRYQDRIYPSIYFENKNIGTLNFEQLEYEITPTFPEQKMVLKIHETEKDFVFDQIYQQNIDAWVWSKAYEQGRSGYFVPDFLFFVTSFFQEKKISIHDIPFTYPLETQQISRWEKDSMLEVVFDGDIIVSPNGVVSKYYPQDGVYIDEDVFMNELNKKLTLGNISDPLVVPLRERKALRNKEDIDFLYEKTQKVLNKTLEMRHPRDERIIVLKPRDIIALTHFNFPLNSKDIFLTFDEEKLRYYSNLFEPKNAIIEVKNYNEILIKNSYSGVLADIPATQKLLGEALLNPEQSNFLLVPLGFIEPELTTEKAQGLGLEHVVSEFTTYYDCCVARADNIALAARLVDGTILQPGETFNLNDFLGERTVKKGFKKAGAIFEGEMVDSVGGGISQFTTTLHNAVYWGAYEVIDHKPHSIYFSRYPEGIEATISWPDVDYIFKNDTSTGIMIDTSVTKTSVTVRIIGNNKGRIFSGEQSGGASKQTIIQAGDISARRVLSSVSERYNFKKPIVRYVPDIQVERGSSFQSTMGKEGWSVRVSRKVFENETELRSESYVVPYRSSYDTLIHVHPCDHPDKEKRRGFEC